jgi:hypothetical protein
MSMTRRQQGLAWLALGGLLLLVGDQVLFTPLVETWKARAARLAEVKRQVTDGEELLAREPFDRPEWNRMRTNMLSGVVSVAENQLLKAFDRWSLESRIGVSGIKPQWKRAQDDRLALECRVDAFGNLSSVTRFLHLVETDPLAIKVDFVELTSRDDAGEQLTLGVQVSGLLLATQGNTP